MELDGYELDDLILTAIKSEVEAQIEESVRFAEESPEPAAEELYTDIYA